MDTSNGQDVTIKISRQPSYLQCSFLSRIVSQITLDMRCGFTIFYQPFWIMTSYQESLLMVTSSNGNIFCVTDPLCGEFTSHRWSPRTKTNDTELWCMNGIWINGWIDNREAGDLGCHHAHYDIISKVSTKSLVVKETLNITHLTKVIYGLDHDI